MVQAQEWLDENYPKEGRSSVTKLDIRGKKLEGILDLTEFTNLEELICWDNRLTSLKLDNCLKLRKIHCHTNQFTQLDLTNLSQLNWLSYGANHLSKVILPPKTEQPISLLEMAINDFPPQDCSVFSGLDLQYLDIRVNRFYGSLEPLKKATKLSFIDISDTDLGSGLEYLPNTIKSFYLLTSSSRKDAKVKILEQELRKYGEPERPEREDNWRNYNFANLLPLWKSANPDKMKIVQQELKIEELTDQISNLEKKVKELITNQSDLQHQLTENQTIINNLQCQLNETIDQLTNANNQLNAWQCPFFWPQPTLGQPDSLLAFRTQVNSFDTLWTTTGFCILGWYFYRKYKVSRNGERQPLLSFRETEQSQSTNQQIQDENAQLKQELTQLQKHLEVLRKKTQQFSTIIEYQISDKQEQLNNLLAATSPTSSSQKEISLIQEEIRILQAQLTEIGKSEQTALQIQPTYGMPGSSQSGH